MPPNDNALSKNPSISIESPADSKIIAPLNNDRSLSVTSNYSKSYTKKPLVKKDKKSSK